MRLIKSILGAALADDTIDTTDMGVDRDSQYGRCRAVSAPSQAMRAIRCGRNHRARRAGAPHFFCRRRIALTALKAYFREIVMPGFSFASETAGLMLSSTMTSMRRSSR